MAWLDTFIEEKGIRLDAPLSVEGPSGTNFMEVGHVVAAIKSAPSQEQASIKKMLVKIDFANGDVMHFLRHLAKAIAI